MLQRLPQHGGLPQNHEVLHIWAVGLQLRKMPSKACVWWGQSVREGLWVCKHGCCFLCLAWLRRNSRPSAPTPASTRNTKPKLALLLFPAN